jgi:glycosyltransferase involved in cell wall biosynthesis
MARITFLLTQSLGDPSGLGRYYPLTKELVKLGYEVSILALHPDLASISQRRLEADGVHVHYVGNMHVRKVGNQKTYFGTFGLLRVALASSVRMSWQALLSETDVVHVGKPHPINGPAAVGARFLRGRDLYLDCDDYEAESNRFSGRWQKAMVALWEDKLPRFAKGMTVNTRFTQKRNIALGFPAERIVYVPNGVDRERFGHVDPRQVQDLRERLGLEDKTVVAYVGSMSLVNHPVNLLLDAFGSVRRQCSNAVLILAGGGEDYDVLRQRAAKLGLQEVALFVGKVPPEEVPLYLAMSDVSVEPVYDDLAAQARSPLKVFESLAVGTPVVTGDVGDRREMLEDGQAGLLVNPGDSDALAEGILALLQDRERAQAMREAALRVRERYYWDVLVKDFVKVYD